MFLSFRVSSYLTRNLKAKTLSQKYVSLYGVYSGGDHLFPFRTEKLSPPAQMVLGLKPGRVCRCQSLSKTLTF